MIAPARAAAYDTVLAVATGRADLPAALARGRTKLSDERDRALAGEIATGTLRWQGAFDHLVAAFSGRPIERLDAEVLTILRISIFQLLHLDRVPAAAVVDDAVELTRRAGKRSAAGFVNALLRRVSRERGNLPLPSAPSRAEDVDAALDYLAITLSHPRWLTARWLARCGFDAAARWTRFNNEPAPLTLRANTLRTSRDRLVEELARAGVQAEPARFAPDALVVRSGNPLLTPLAHTGTFLVQDEASQLVGLYAAAAPGELILDACASPGGKTTQMAAMMKGQGLVVAADVRGRRVDLLSRTVRDAAARSVRVVQADALAAPAFQAVFDAILVDAPCSGLGIIRRDPDVRWRRKEEDLAHLAAAQRQMLAQAATVVRPGGRIVYATCSSEPEENEAVVEAFVAARPEFRRTVPAAFRDSGLSGLLDADGALHTLPFRDGLEAFYAATLMLNY